VKGGVGGEQWLARLLAWQTPESRRRVKFWLASGIVWLLMAACCKWIMFCNGSRLVFGITHFTTAILCEQRKCQILTICDK
jgi:hypothetical protein